MTFDEVIDEKYTEYIAVKKELKRITERKNELVKIIKEFQEARESYIDGLCREANLCKNCSKKRLCETYGDMK